MFVDGLEKISVDFNVSDVIDPNPIFGAVFIQTVDKGEPRADKPERIEVSSFSIVNPRDMDDGLWVMEVAAKDYIGNSTVTYSGIFEIARDSVAPVTVLAFYGEYANINGENYITSASSVALSAEDVLVNSTASGVAFSEFRIDVDTSAPFNLYDDALQLAEGEHLLEFRSVDNAGNFENLRSTAVYCDNTPPVTELLDEGQWAYKGDIRYISSISSVSFSANDPQIFNSASGVDKILYKTLIDGIAVEKVYTGPFLAPAGISQLNYRAVDNLNNYEETKSAIVYVDEESPTTVPFVQGISGENGWYVSSAILTLVSTDSLSGVKQIGYRVEGLGESGEEILISSGVYSELIQINREGIFIVYYWAEDKVGNKAAVEAMEIKIDKSAPITIAEISGDKDLNDWHVSAVSMVFDLMDSISGIEESYYRIEKLEGEEFLLLSSGTYSESLIVGNEGNYKAYYWSKDKAGNVETEKTIEFKIDLISPAVIASSAPAANIYGWNNEPITVSFTGTDNMSGIDRIGYRVEGLGESEGEKLYTNPVQISSEGANIMVTGIVYDYAGWSSTKALSVSIDNTLPVITYSRTPANAEGWNNTDVTVKFVCSDELSGIKSCPQDILFADEGVNISTTTEVEDKADNI
ncbi:MAG: hypothetical protein KAJ48_07510, partial [Elusimicrobiales bacterium]|nr:hypothetical protein [Elusimicrobiales bacterium]